MENNNTNIIVERISDKKAEKRLVQMGKKICPKAKTVAQPVSELKKLFKKGSLKQVFIDGVPFAGEEAAIEKFINMQLKNNKIKKVEIKTDDDKITTFTFEELSM